MLKYNCISSAAIYIWGYLFIYLIVLYINDHNELIRSCRLSRLIIHKKKELFSYSPWPICLRLFFFKTEKFQTAIIITLNILDHQIVYLCVARISWCNSSCIIVYSKGNTQCHLRNNISQCAYNCAIHISRIVAPRFARTSIAKYRFVRIP